MNRLVLILTALTVLILTGCATNSVESRRKERAAAYTQFPPEIKQLVDEGRIKAGMSMDAVYIAWGPPAQVLHSGTQAGEVTTWLYEGAWLEEDRYWVGRGGRHGYGPVVTYDYQPRSYVSAEVTFVNGVVTQWRTLPAPVY